MTKAQFMHAAECFDSWRVVPRTMLFMYAWFVYKVTFYILTWYFHEPATGRGTQETAVILGVFTAITGLAGVLYKVYSDAGRDWTNHPVDDHDGH